MKHINFLSNLTAKDAVNRALAAERNAGDRALAAAKMPQNTGGGNSQHCALRSEGARTKKEHAEGKATSGDCRLNNLGITYVSPRYHLGLTRWGQHVACMLMVLAMSVGEAWGTNYYVIPAKCNVNTGELVAGADGNTQLFKTDESTVTVNTDISTSITTTAGFYYNSTSTTYENLTKTSNYGTSQGASRTMRGIKLEASTNCTITVNEKRFSKLDVIYRCASNDSKALTIDGESCNTSDQNIHLKSITKDYTSNIIIANGSNKEYQIFVILTEGATLPEPTATFNAGIYAIGGSALDLSSLWTSDSDGAVTFSVDSAGTTGASVSTAAFTATTAGYAKVKAVQVATATKAAITKYAYIQVGNATTGSHTLTYTLDVPSSSANDSKTTINTTYISTSIYLNTLVGLTNNTGSSYGTGDKVNMTVKVPTTTSYTASKYTSVGFTVEDGYKFTPTSITVKIQPVTAATNAKLILTDGTHSIEKEQTGLTVGSLNTLTMTNDGNVEFTGDVALKIYDYGDTKCIRFGSPITITGTVAEEVAGCSDWGLYYGTDRESDWDKTCFTQVGSTTEWQIEDFVIPAKPNWYVDNSTENDARKVLSTWSNLYFAASQGDGARPMVGNTATGAVGTVRIYDDSGWNNRYAGFIPDGYKLKFGSTYKDFAVETGNEYRSEIVEYSSSNARDAVSVGIVDASGNYVSTDNSEGMQHLFLNTGGSSLWSTDNVSTFGLYNITGSSFSCLMTKVPGEDYLYEGWVPSTCTKVIFVRLKSSTLDWGDGNANVHNQTSDLTLESGKNYYTIGSWDNSSNTWSAYEKKGKFRMWNNSTEKNWYVNFYPYNVLTYNANGGSGAPAAQSVAADAASKTVSVAANGFTAPTGKHFTGWNTAADGSGDSYAAGASYTLSADATLYAQWAPILVTEISVSPSSKTLDVGGTQTLSATATPSTALDKTVTWSSSTTSVATVSSAGVVTAVAPGSATITATANDGSGTTGTCAITVNKITPTKYDFSVIPTTICPGSTATLTLENSESGVTYQLYSDSSTPIAGTQKAGTGSALTWTGLGAGTYRPYAIADATHNAKEMGSNKVTVTTATATSITTQPSGIADATVGEEQTLTVVAAGTNLSYQWKESATEDGTYSNMASGGTSASYSVTPAAAGTKWYQVVVTGDCGEVTSNKVSIVAAAAVEYTVTYNANGGTVSPTSETVSTATLPMPTKTDYTFAGWYTSSGTKAGDAGEDYEPAGDITLYALWREDACAGGGGGGTEVLSSVAVNSSYDVTASVGSAAKNGFDGSDRTQIGSSSEYANKLGSSGYVRLFPKTGSSFAAGDILYYKVYNGKSSAKSMNIAVYKNDETKYEPSAVSINASVTHEFEITLTSAMINATNGYVQLMRGSTNGDGAWFVSARIEHSGGSATCYYVTYNGNGADGGFTKDEASHASGSDVTVASNSFSREGYTFTGWNTEVDGSGTDYAAGETISGISSNMTLYAQWSEAAAALVTNTLATGEVAWSSSITTAAPSSITNLSALAATGLTISGNGNTNNGGQTAKVTGTESDKNTAEYLSLSFRVACGKKLTVTGVEIPVQPVTKNNSKFEAVLTDGRTTITGTQENKTNGTLNDIEFDSYGYLQGDVTLKIYAWGWTEGYRLGKAIKIYGTIDDEATPTATIRWTKEPAGGLSGTNETVTAVSSDGSAVTITSNNSSVATVSGSTVSYVGVGSTYLIASGTDACGNVMVSVNSDNFTVIGAYDLTYDMNGGTGTMDADETGVHYAVVAENAFTAPSGKTFYGWNTAADGSGDSYQPGDAIELSANTTLYAQWGTALSATWNVTKVDDKLYRGGGGYRVTVYLDQADWDEDGNKDDLELTATEGVTLKDITRSINAAGKAQVEADFDITTDLAEDATQITFTLSVPAAGDYAAAELTDDEDLEDCAGRETIIFSMRMTAYNACEVNSTYGGSCTLGGYSSSSSDNVTANEHTHYKPSGTLFNATLKSGLKFQAGDSLVLYMTADSDDKTTGYKICQSTGSSTLVKDVTKTMSKGTEYTVTSTLTAAMTTIVGVSSIRIDRYNSNVRFYGVDIIRMGAGGGGVTPTLSWSPALESDASWNSTESRLDKEVGDADFTFTATQDMNSLGTISYSSSNTSVATVNATTGKVHIGGAAGEATITATLAASGCFDQATATYTINVIDNCIDEPGTITSRDLGCDGIELTVSGHTALTGVTYQWYKDGVSLGSATGAQTAIYTATVAGEYYVVVTNPGTDHCEMASTNTVVIAAKAAAEATKIVDSWYVKNGRRTPAVALVQSENAESFTIKSGSTVIWNSDGSVTTGFGGCGFHIDENGIIYLNGTKDNGDATSGLTAGDETLTITVNGCGGNASQDITIHKQVATDRPSIAFVVDGTKNTGAFDADNESHSVNTALYKYLDYTASGGTGAFDLTAQNIYATTNEKSIREHYSQFDAILITDDPGTKETPNGDYKTKGYVNAFGTMIDVRPILTMEAYVSALANWKTKGIAGTPTSPNPRQYALRLECKDHEIYKDGLPDPAAGTHVWDETIDGQTYRNVILVDSTKSPYAGVAYNEQTEGNQSPALQGFDGSASGHLLGLGRISEGALQAAIERQEEPAARLLVFSIQAKALPNALTDEGKAVIRNILTYLLKTNMEEVDDCSNYFVGGATEGDPTSWTNLNNWSKNSGEPATTLPSYETKVRILAPCVMSGTQVNVAQIDIATSGNSSIRQIHRSDNDPVCNGKLTIESTAAVTVAGKVRTADAPHFGAEDLKPTTPSDLIINTGSTAQAALIFNNDDASAQATVNYYSLGRKISGDYQYQYFAIPMEYVSVSPTFANENHGGTKIYTYVYNAGTGWTRRGYYDDLYAFEGLGITTNTTADHMDYTMTGTLASTATKEISLSNAGDGYNLVGNSWMAPIQIAALSEDNTDANITKTAYIYSTGHDGGTGVIADAGGKEQAGQWIPVPFAASGESAWREAGKLSVIPAMQAFQIKTDADATLTLDYSKVVRGSTNSLNEKMRAPRRTASREGTAMSIIRVSDSKTYTDVCLIEGEQFSDAFDNGWEAEFMEGDGRSAQFYAMNGEDKMAVMATDELEGTPVCFAPGKESDYTISFFGGDGRYYLNDLKEEQSTMIEQGNTYSFTYEEGDMPHRFLISTTPFGIPSVTTGCGGVEAQEKVQKVIYNDHVYIIRGGKIYDVMGKMMK